ncbi:hypothetical protein [Cellulomonas bogoriensis]|uniref:Uncharacterized protein n=1 Tax=Cellulomonas bogoriensis 69B4 = DSM 16987 TaxID=1386082 RepID=A0A0A0C1I7_9CELL|nr:hypothetical protein [Cellulomonas bogoriensis]KGM13807.1 hypothetical protein N869_09635 [Cellulomonas bogoriensis 69B4 = DSM 16987]
MATPVVLTIALALTGCTGDEPGSAATDDARAPDDQVSRQLDAARQQGASEEQLQIIESGEVTFDAYEAAVLRTIECLQDEGFDVDGPEVVELSGFPEVTYTYPVWTEGRTDEEAGQVARACEDEHSSAVQGLYRNSPEAQQAQAALVAEHRPAVVTCLQDQGVEATGDEELDALDTLVAQGEEATGTNCYLEQGIFRVAVLTP